MYEIKIFATILMIVGIVIILIATIVQRTKLGKNQSRGNNLVPCSSCGTKNHASSKFCSNCGTPLSASEIKPVVEPAKPEVYDFRHIRDVKKQSITIFRVSPPLKLSNFYD